MTILTLVMRNDLNMRTGKMAAQAAHAAMKLFFSQVDQDLNTLSLPIHQYEALNNFVARPVVHVEFVSSEQALLEIIDRHNGQTVIDNGFTEFKGVQTFTCGAFGLFNKEGKGTAKLIELGQSGIKSRQYLIFSRKSKLKKDAVCQMAAIGCLSQFFKLLTISSDLNTAECSLDEASALYHWMLNGYGKIGLSVPDDDSLVELAEQFADNWVSTTITDHDGMLMLTTEPAFVSEVEHLTHALKLI